MAPLHRLSFLLPALTVLMGAVASPLNDPQVKEFFAREKSIAKPLAKRAGQGRQSMHVREFKTEDDHQRLQRFTKRDVDLGAMQTVPDGSDPAPIRGTKGLSYLGPHNPAADLQNLDEVAGPPTDSGTVVNLKWTFSQSRTTLLNGGWVREQTITDLPPSKDFAAAELRLGPNAYRELHWHRVAEWGYILGGSGRIVAVDNDGKQFVGDLQGPVNGTEGDLYIFPPGVPHSIQAFGDGLEILILFSDGNFDASGTTFHASDWLVHTPLEILAQNFQVDASVFEKLPAKYPYVFYPTVPPVAPGKGPEAPSDPNGNINNYIFRIRDQEKAVAPGGGGYTKLQTADTNFKPSALFASQFVHIEPNGLRELHWNNNDEWIYILSGKGRATAFPGGQAARTFDFQAGDTGVFPTGYGHYMKNISPNETLAYLEVWKTPNFTEFTAQQWLALMPPQNVADLLNISTDVVSKFKTEKQVIIKG